MSRQPAWDEYEAVLLADAYLRVKNGNQAKLTVLQELSNTLRTLALNRGIAIDDTYRNLNGMLWQYGFIEMAFQDTSYDNRKPSKLFKHITAMYKEGQSDFIRLLGEAREMALHQSCQFLKKSLEQIVLDHFPNGIQPDSIIDQKKVNRLFIEKFGHPMRGDADYKTILYDLGITVGKRVYVLSKAQQGAIVDTVKSLFNTENHVLFYEKLLQIPLFEECHLYDPRSVKMVIMSLLPEAVYENNYVLTSENASVLGDILNAFGNDIKLSYSEIIARKPYLEMTSIKWELSYSGEFVWTENETYAQERLIELAEEDIRNVETQFLPCVDKDGFASLRQLVLEDSCSLNPNVSYYAIREVMYLRYMKDMYSRNGLIITKRGDTKTSIEILSEYCKSLRASTLDEINIYGQELLGNQPIKIVSAAVYNMIRISRTNFVSDDQVSFDIEATDNALAQFVSEKVIPLSVVSSFNAFPDMEGYSWNLFILDCFLRRFSVRFSICGGPAQTNIVGGIYPKSMNFASYADLMAYAVLQDDISLCESKVSDYLIDNKYILRRGPIIKKVFAAALKLSELRSASIV